MGELLTSGQKCPKTMSCTRRDAGSLFSQIIHRTTKFRSFSRRPGEGNADLLCVTGPNFQRTVSSFTRGRQHLATGRFTEPPPWATCQGKPASVEQQADRNTTDSFRSVNTDLRFFSKYKPNAIPDLGNYPFSLDVSDSPVLSGAVFQR